MKEKKINRITLKSTDIDEFALMLKNVDVENILMEKGEFNVKMTLVASPNVRLTKFYMNRKIIQKGTRASGFVTFLIWDPKFLLNWRNNILGKNQIAVLWNQEHYTLSEGGIQGFPISIDENYLKKSLITKGYPEMIPILKNIDSLFITELLLQKLRFKIAMICQFENLNVRGMYNLIEVELVDDLINCLISSYEDSSRPELLHHKFSTTIDYIQNNLNEISSVRQVSEFLHIPERTLRYHFERKYNMSPKDFIQKLRLNAVKKRLSADTENSIIYKIASEFNFWHMGQFTRDYKCLFGELPSETIKQRKVSYDMSREVV